MHSFYYKKGSNALGAATMAAFAIGAGKIWVDHGGVILLGFTLLMLFGTAKATLDALSSTPALRFDRHSLWIRKAWGGVQEVPWRNVHDVAMKVFTVRYMGIIPVSRTAYITVTCEGGLFGAQRLRVSSSALGFSPARSVELVAILKQAHVDAVGEAAAAMAGAGRVGWGIDTRPRAERERAPASSFDADGAFEHYLASKRQDEPQSAPAMARPAMPPRPTFGRRAG